MTSTPQLNGASRDADAQGRMMRLKRELHNRLISGFDLNALRRMDEDCLRWELRRGAEELCRNRGELMTAAERDELIEELVDETLGLGPLEPLMRDPTISDILINGPRTVYVERRGKLERTNIRFHDDEHLLSVVQRIAARVGRRLDESSPMVDARLPDGSRVNAVIRPLALDGALVSIRRFNERALTAADLVARHTAASEMLEFLAECVKARLNIMISGGTGAGKTTLLNMLSNYIPEDQRVATIEDAAELQLQQPHVARMETRSANVEGLGEVTSRDLVKNALRMRPDRILVGECRGGEAFDMLQAMSTGHDGSLTTIHANDTRAAISRLEMLVGMAGYDLPLWFIQRQIASCIHLVVQVARLGGARKITRISEVTGLESDLINMHDLFVFEQTGIDESGGAEGRFVSTGIRPQCWPRLQAAGAAFALDFFERRSLHFQREDGILGLPI